MTRQEITRARIGAAFAEQSANGSLPLHIEVQPGIWVELAAHHITVFEPNHMPVTVPAHVRDGRVWPGARAQEERTRTRVRDLSGQRDVLQIQGRLTNEADDALDLAERTLSRNAVLRYIPEPQSALDTTEAGEKWGLTPSRVRQLCIAGRVPGAKKIGRDWVIPVDATITPKGLSEMKPVYHACYYQTPDGQGEIVLTSEEEAGLSDTDLIERAVVEAHNASLIGDKYPSISESALRAGLHIGEWRER